MVACLDFPMVVLGCEEQDMLVATGGSTLPSEQEEPP